MNKCAMFYRDSPSGKKLNSVSRVRLNFRTRPFMCQLCIETVCKRAIWVAYLTNFSFDIFMKFSQKLPLYFFEFGSLREEDAMSLERIQASAARSLLQADWFTPKEELFRQLGWAALRWRRKISNEPHDVPQAPTQPSGTTQRIYVPVRKCHLS